MASIVSQNISQYVTQHLCSLNFSSHPEPSQIWSYEQLNDYGWKEITGKSCKIFEWWAEPNGQEQDEPNITGLIS